MHFRILKMIATGGFLTALECIQFVCGLGERTALPRPPEGLRGPTSKGRGGERKRRKGVGQGEEENGKEGERRRMEGKGRMEGKYKHPSTNLCVRPWKWSVRYQALGGGGRYYGIPIVNFV